MSEMWMLFVGEWDRVRRNRQPFTTFLIDMDALKGERPGHHMQNNPRPPVVEGGVALRYLRWGSFYPWLKLPSHRGIFSIYVSSTAGTW